MGFPFENRPYFELLETCRLVSNTIKHGDGTSCQKLAENAPGLLQGLYQLGIGTEDPKADKLWIELETFTKFAWAIDRFWNEFPDRLTVSISDDQ